MKWKCIFIEECNKKGGSALYIYNARYNFKKITNWNDLEILTGISKGELIPIMDNKINIPGLNHCYLVTKKTSKDQLIKLHEKNKFKNEVWKEWDENYSVSNYGRIKNINNGKYLLPWIKRRKGKDKWLCVKLYGEEIEVHKLVALLFLENTNGLECIWHKNGLFWDNHYKNLEYMSRKELGYISFINKKGHKSIIAKDNVTGKIIGKFKTSVEVEEKFYINSQSVLNNLNGKTKKVADGRYSFIWEE